MGLLFACIFIVKSKKCSHSLGQIQFWLQVYHEFRKIFQRAPDSIVFFPLFAVSLEAELPHFCKCVVVTNEGNAGVQCAGFQTAVT